jgi:hypothetical protein
MAKQQLDRISTFPILMLRDVLHFPFLNTVLFLTDVTFYSKARLLQLHRAFYAEPLSRL